MERFIRTERETLKLRLVAALGAATGLYLHQDKLTLSLALLLAAVYLLYLLYCLALRYYILPRTPYVGMIYVMIVVDTAALTSMLFVTRTVNTTLIVLFPLFIIYYSIHLGYAGSFLAATLATVGLVTFGLLQGINGGLDKILVVQVVLFYIIATFSGYLGHKSIRQETEKEALQELLNVESGARSLLDVARTLNSTLDLDLLLQDISDLAPRITGFSKCVAMLVNEDTGVLIGKATNLEITELGVDRIEDLIDVPLASSLAMRAWESNAPVAFSNKEENEDGIPASRNLGDGIILAIPLVSGGKRVGIIYAFEGRRGYALTEAAMQLAKGYGDLSAMAIANAKLYGEAQDRITSLVKQLEATVNRIERMREPKRKTVLNINGLRIDTIEEKVSVGRKSLELSPTEYRLLYALAETAGTPVSPDYLFRKTWGDVYRGQTNVVDVYIHRLRKKLEDDASSPRRILTVRGIGYKLAAND